MPSPSEQRAIRTAAMAWLSARTSDGLESLGTDDLLEFSIDGHRVPLKDRQQGIYKPAGWDSALSIATVFRTDESRRPYNDDVGADGLLRYKWRGEDAHHYVNVSLRVAMRDHDPLIWFFGTGVGMWKPIYPVYILAEEPSERQFVVDPDVAATLPIVGSVVEESLRRYVVAEVRARLHQPVFRAKVMRAYSTSCAVCTLRHGQLLDAAHIVPDGMDRGDPVIPNGLALCKIHHAAFDSHILGITPDYGVQIRQDLLEEIDGPMLRHGLQDVHGQALRVLPSRRAERPDRERLAWAYERFRAAG